MLATLLLALPLPQDSAPVFVLMEGAEGLVVEPLSLVEGEPLTLVSSAATGLVDVVLPPGPGGSGSIVDLRQERTLELLFAEGALHVTERNAAGQVWERPAQELAALAGRDTRVCVTDAAGAGRSFVIHGWAEAFEDDIGPVFDVFAGRIPLQEGQRIVCTDTTPHYAGPPVHGEAPLEHARYLFLEGELPGGAKGTFVLDLGAAETLVDRSFVPEGVPIAEAGMTQYTAAGVEELRYEPDGATGAVRNVLGHATLPALRFGTLRFPSPTVAVLDGLPQVFGRPVAGILGLDLLRAAETVSIGFADGARTLRLAPTLPPREAGAVELPMTLVKSHLMVRALVNEHPVAFVLDSGAPTPILDGRVAEAGFLRDDARDGVTARGLGSGSTALRPATATIGLGATRLADLELFVGDLAVFDTLRGKDDLVGLLGNSVFARFGRLELDFGARKMRLGAGK